MTRRPSFCGLAVAVALQLFCTFLWLKTINENPKAATAQTGQRKKHNMNSVTLVDILKE